MAEKILLRIEKGKLVPADELWRAVVGYEGRYEVSNYGRIYRLPAFRRNGFRIRPGFLKQCMRSKSDPRKAYLCVGLNDGTKSKTHSVHVLVLEAFIGPRPKPDIHGCHSDGNPENNHLSNLRWDTAYGNCIDRRRHGRENPPKTVINDPASSKPIIGINHTGEIKEFPSISEAGRCGFSPSSISRCLSGKLKTSGGYAWRLG